MKNERASLFETLETIKAAVKFKIERRNTYSYMNDRIPLYGLEKLLFILSTLQPKELKKAIKILSSVNYGRHILTTVFPKIENPQEYHSTEDVIYLEEQPVQVIGWKGKEDLVLEGVEKGFGETWIDYGFEVEAE